MQASFVVRLALVLCLAGCAVRPGSDFSVQVSSPKNTAAKKTLRAFRSEQELAAYFKELAP